MSKKKTSKKKNIRKHPHVNHRSGSGPHNSTEKRLRTRREILRKEIEERN
jgi:hypothetical protein